MSVIFDKNIVVQAQHIDFLGQLNHVNYAQWMYEIAIAHTQHLGLGLEEYQQLKHAMVLVEQQVQYRKAVFVDQDIVLRTWINAVTDLYVSRQYVFYRKSDQSIVCAAKTKWACAEIGSGRTKRLSPTFLAAHPIMNTQIDPLDFTVFYL